MESNVALSHCKALERKVQIIFKRLKDLCNDYIRNLNIPNTIIHTRARVRNLQKREVSRDSKFGRQLPFVSRYSLRNRIFIIRVIFSLSRSCSEFLNFLPSWKIPGKVKLLKQLGRGKSVAWRSSRRLLLGEGWLSFRPISVLKEYLN